MRRFSKPRSWWDLGPRNPFRGFFEEEEHPSEDESLLLLLLVRLGLAVFLIVVAGHRPDDESEISLLVASVPIALIMEDYDRRRYIWIPIWLVLMFFANPLWVPDFETIVWQLLSYFFATCLFLSWLVPIYFRKRLERKQRRADARLAQQSVPPQVPTPRTSTHKARTTYPAGDQRRPSLTQGLESTGPEEIDTP